MPDGLIVAALAWAAGVTAFLGGLGAARERFAESERKQQFIHANVAFGGGILLAAVAFSLAPRAIKHLDAPGLLFFTLLGGGLFCLVDAWLERRGGSRAQLLAMIMDFVPEAIALGAVFAGERKHALLLALFIAAQNLPEGFNAFREMRTAGSGSGRILTLLLLVSLLGPLAALLGYLLLQNSETVTAAMMAFASGGILYLMFQDIAPQAAMKRHWSPSLGAVAGFSLGMLGSKLIL